jgi:hypothetical protein
MALLQSGTRIYGTANVDTQINVGANLYVNTSGITITGNTTTVPTITLFSNSTAGSLNIGNTTSTSLPSITVANSTGNVSITATSLAVDGVDTINSTGIFTTGTVNAASHTVGTAFTANSTVVNAVAYNIGTVFTANSTLVNASANLIVGNIFTVGNSSVNTFANSTHFYAGNSTYYGFGNSTVDVLVNPTGNLQLSPVSVTLSNASATVLLANLSGIYSNGTVNAASHTVGTSFIANTTQVTLGSTVGLSANGSLGTANQVLTSNGSAVYWANSTGGGGGGGFTNGQSISVNNFSITGAFSANGANGTAGQILVSNSTGGPYWTSNYVVRQQFTANGTANTFTITGGYSANNLDVYLNGVKLYNGTEANVSSGSTVTILGANPANGSLIEVVGTTQSASLSSTVVNQQITANGTANSFAVAGGYIPNGIQVYLNGVKQIPGVDVIISSGANVGFTVTPSNNHIIDIYGYQTAVASVVGGATGGGTDQVFFVSSQNVTSSYAIPSGKSAMAVGPIKLANGVVITVPSGSRWVIL